MTLIPSLVNWFTAKRINQIDQFRKNPVEVQYKTFLNLIAKAIDTEWGNQHGYGSITSISDYQKNVPIQTYEDLTPYINRLKMGERDLLWPGEINWFAKSSGTTNSKSKFIPISTEALQDCHYRGARDILAIYTSCKPDTGIFSGKGLTLGGSQKLNNLGNSSVSGDLSAILIDNAPPWIDMIRTPKSEIALISDFEEKLGEITKYTIDENVTNIAGVPSWCLVMMRHILAETGKSNIHEVWPNIEVFFHGGINFSPYREQYKLLLPGDHMSYMESYNASEGFFGIQDDMTSNDMLLMLDYGVFYEFIAVEKLTSDSPPTLTIGEVEAGINYAIVITTNAGLWRYLIGDTIVFTSLYPHKFRITGRTKHFINAFGEEVIIDNAEKALASACSESGSLISEYTAGPVYMSSETKGSHEWVIEFEKEPVSLGRFTLTLDKTLQSVNSDYEAKRHKDLTLTMPLITVVPKGTFYNWFREKNKLGGQHKVPRLSNTREYIDDLRKFAGIN